MTSEYTGGGQPDRSLAVLWRTLPAPARGPRPGLDVDQIVATAIEVADREGLAAVSMRRIADQLGVGTMSLYTYVPGKAELLDAMADQVCAETARPDHQQGHWRDSLEQIADQNWQLLLRHPWLLSLSTAHPPLGPQVTAKYDYELRAIDGIGLDDVEMDTVLSVVLGHTESTARRAVDAARLAVQTKLSDEQWWAANASILEQLLDPTRFPTAVRVGHAAGEAHNAAANPRAEFEFGLQRFLDGIQNLLDSRTSDVNRPTNHVVR